VVFGAGGQFEKGNSKLPIVHRRFPNSAAAAAAAAENQTAASLTVC